MCSANEWMQSPSRHQNRDQKQQQSRKYRVRVHCLVLRNKYDSTTKNIELKNLKLYLENRNILEENERLREKAIRLRQENQVLLSEFQKKCNSYQISKT